MNTTDAGRLGEAKAIHELTKHGWYPFTDISGKCPVDILAWKDGRVIRIQVKTTGTVAKSGNYIAQIGCTRPNRTGNTIKKFNPKDSDYLAVYIEPTDTLYFILSSSVTVGRELTITSKIVSVIPE